MTPPPFHVRATLTVDIRPALLHLDGEGGTVATVDSTMVAGTQEEIEQLLPGLAWQLVHDLAHAITAHPRRPTPNETHSLRQWEFIHEVNTGVYPQLRPTPADPGHVPGKWTDCPRCIHRITERGDDTA